MTVAEVQAVAQKHYPQIIAHYQRWVSHYENRLIYERAMLVADGGTVADKTGPEVGGTIRCWASCRGGWSCCQSQQSIGNDSGHTNYGGQT
jgi:hypothetical protein